MRYKSSNLRQRLSRLVITIIPDGVLGSVKGSIRFIVYAPKYTQGNYIFFDQRCDSRQHIGKLLTSLSSRCHRLSNVMHLFVGKGEVVCIRQNELIKGDGGGTLVAIAEYMSRRKMAKKIGSFGRE